LPKQKKERIVNEQRNSSGQEDTCAKEEINVRITGRIWGQPGGTEKKTRSLPPKHETPGPGSESGKEKKVSRR